MASHITTWISGFISLLFFQYAGTYIAHITNAPIPGAVLGMLLLFVLLQLLQHHYNARQGQDDSANDNHDAPNSHHQKQLFDLQDVFEAPIIRASHTLIAVLPLLFIPACVGIFYIQAISSDQWIAIGAAILIGTPLSMAVTTLLMRSLLTKAPNNEQPKSKP